MLLSNHSFSFFRLRGEKDVCCRKGGAAGIRAAREKEGKDVVVLLYQERDVPFCFAFARRLMTKLSLLLLVCGKWRYGAHVTCIAVTSSLSGH